jgi:NAD(P)-dependent dehydrogenase (short-subunit alcohol dehydrogenase family)
MKDVDGKVAFITGGASGIGFGIARAFLNAGMKVVIADVNEGHLAEARDHLKGNNKVHFIKVDVSDREAMARAADETERVFGKVHIVCNNAGVSGGKPMDEASYTDWDRMMAINVGGVVNGVTSFMPKLKKHGEGGHIVNTSSMAGLIPLPGAGGIYSATKFAVRGISDSLRLNLAKDNIGVSVLCPGLTRSRMSAGAATRQVGQAAPASDSDPGMDPDAAGMDPLQLGEAVLRGIQNNAPYIIAHGEFKEEVTGLFDEILGAFPESWDDADERRLAFEDRRREMTELARQGKKPEGF